MQDATRGADSRGEDFFAEMERNGVNAEELLFYIYTHYKDFNLQSLPEDERYDFIVGLYPFLQRLQRTYDKSRNSLECYLKSLVHLRKKSWKREQFHQRAREYIVTAEYGEQAGYGTCECSDVEAVYNARNPERAPKLNKFIVKHLPAFALRSSWYLTDAHIKRICAICNLDEEEFTKTVHELNASLERRLAWVNRWRESMVYSYALQKRYQYEMTASTDETYANAFYLRQRLAKCLGKGDKMSALRAKTSVHTPVSLIAQALGKSESRVSNDIRFFRAKYAEFFGGKPPPE